MHELENLALQFINIILFMLVIAYFAKDHVRGFFKDRACSLKELMDESQKASTKAREALNLWEVKLGALEEEKDEIIDHARSQAHIIGQKRIENVKAFLKRQLDETKTRLEIQEKEAIASKRCEFLASLAKEARDDIESKLTPRDQRNILVNAIKILEKV